METLTAEVRDRILILTLANASDGNSFSLAEAKQLAAHLRSYRGQFDGILWRAQGTRFFCTGGNLRFYASLKSRTEGLKANLQIRRVLHQFAKLPQPKVAVVQGDCLGGGMEVLSVFDHVVALPHVFLGFWQRRLSLTFGWGGGARWERKLGTDVLLRMMLEARSYSSYESLRAGLIHAIHLPDSIQAEGEQWLLQAMALPREPLPFLRAWKTSKESTIFSRLWLNPSHTAVLAKFLKRDSK